MVALTDVDCVRGAQDLVTWPREPTKYKDFRRMLDKQGKDIDAVVIGTPDHMHATSRWPACSWANTSTSRSR